MGLAIKSNVAVPNPAGAFKKLRKDAVLTPGSLLLVDFAHSYDPLTGGVPAAAALCPNIAWEEAAALHGSGSRTDWKLPFDKGGAFTGAGSDGFMERSSKGGIHVCMSQSTADASGNYLLLGLYGGSSHKLKDYLYANWEHEYYFDSFERVTRLAANAGAPTHLIGNSSSSTVNFLNYGTRDAHFAANKQEYAYSALPQAAVGPQHRAVRNLGRSGSVPASATAIAINLGVGQMGPWNSLYQNQHRSSILYGYYLEDLTVSGRGFDEVKALRAAIFNKDVLTSGGKYYGDSFTAVATCP